MGFDDLDFTTIHDVLDSWEKLRRRESYDIQAGTILFTHLFTKCPHAKVLFGFPLDTPCEKLTKSKRFVAHAKYMIAMLDRALNMLGPDSELLTEVMTDLGKKHVNLGIKDVYYYSIMGDSLLLALGELLEKDFTPGVEKSWTIVYGELASAMISEIENEK